MADGFLSPSRTGNGLHTGLLGTIGEESDDEDGDYFDDDPLFAVLLGSQHHAAQRTKARAKPKAQPTEAEWQARYQSQSGVPLKKKKARRLTFMSDVPQRPLLPRPTPGLAPAGAPANAGVCDS
jgi:hypothetical protein